MAADASLAPSRPAEPRIGTLVRALTRSVSFRGLPRLLYGTRRALLGREKRFFRLGPDHVLLLDPADYVECMMFYGRYSAEILGVLRWFVRPGDRVADIGGHVGYFTTHLARLVGPSGRVFTFEPDPRARERLLGSVERNGMSWVTVLPIAASASAGSIDFYLSPQLGWSTAVRDSHLTGLQKTTVQTRPLDELVRDGTVAGPLRLIKIDIEGFEIEALRGMGEVLRTMRPVLVSEVNPLLLRAQGFAPQDLVREVRGHGYEVFELRSRGHWWLRRHGGHRPGEGDLARLLGPVPEGDTFVGDIVCIPTEAVPASLRRPGRA